MSRILFFVLQLELELWGACSPRVFVSVGLKYWVDQKVHLVFSLRSYGKTQTDLLANPVEELSGLHRSQRGLSRQIPDVTLAAAQAVWSLHDIGESSRFELLRIPSLDSSLLSCPSSPPSHAAQTSASNFVKAKQTQKPLSVHQ